MQDPYDLLYNDDMSGKQLPDDVDELIDGLPLHQQNKILEHYGAQPKEDAPPPRPKFRRKKLFVLLTIPAVVWALGWLGLAAMFALVLPPLAIICVMVATVPVGLLATWWVESVQQPPAESR